ncbi:replication-relaxation family protein [Staphylospora marina]|uniref:replication-relaxation family protein n=1 Tax=Staphylospora marina TaxID=2490858 RepID=UPI000F5BD0AC|nr:replication-relaxation family protein [Staphylospora marina]
MERGRIFPWLDEKETPHLTQMERIMITIYMFGVVTIPQLMVITGWPKSKVMAALNRIRRQGKTPEGKNDWLIYWVPGPGKPYIYTLGQKSIEHVCAIRKEQIGNGKRKKRPHKKGHMWHFLGFNEIICRLLGGGVPVDEFMVGKEVMSWIYHKLIQRKYIRDEERVEVDRPDFLPVKPDGLVEVNGEEYFLEYDTGSEPALKLRERLERYIDFYPMLKDRHKGFPTTLWITVTPNRRATIERVAQQINEKWSDVWSRPTFPKMYTLVEGEEVDFLKGHLEIDPFWEGE